jgi:hypothetical protein
MTDFAIPVRLEPRSGRHPQCPSDVRITVESGSALALGQPTTTSLIWMTGVWSV